jgi:hypothetical protein
MDPRDRDGEDRQSAGVRHRALAARPLGRRRTAAEFCSQKNASRRDSVAATVRNGGRGQIAAFWMVDQITAARGKDDSDERAP